MAHLGWIKIQLAMNLIFYVQQQRAAKISVMFHKTVTWSAYPY
jgi:hypothetical protein